jgi:hypothetical protein
LQVFGVHDQRGIGIEPQPSDLAVVVDEVLLTFLEGCKRLPAVSAAPTKRLGLGTRVEAGAPEGTSAADRTCSV